MALSLILIRTNLNTNLVLMFITITGAAAMVALPGIILTTPLRRDSSSILQTMMMEIIKCMEEELWDNTYGGRILRQEIHSLLFLLQHLRRILSEAWLYRHTHPTAFSSVQRKEK